MKKSTTILYKIGFILDLVGVLVFLALLITGIVLNNSGSELYFPVTNTTFDGNTLVTSGIIGLVVGLIALLFTHVGMTNARMRPAWKRVQVSALVVSILSGNIFVLIASILAILDAKNHEEKIHIVYKDPLTYLDFNKKERFVFKVTQFFVAIPGFFKKIGIAIGRFFKKLGIGLFNFLKNIGVMFVKGSWKTKISYVVMGFGNMARRQFLRGLLFLAFEAVFIIYMIFMGASSFSRLSSLGELATLQYLQTVGGIQTPVVKYVDNSFNILLFGVLTIFFVVGLLYTWYLNITQSYTLDLLQKAEKKIMHDKDDIHALVDQDFYKTLLSLPLVGILVFTILPIFFMVLVAFTNYDKNHFPPTNLFSWVGGSNFQQLFVWSNSGGASFSATFGQILLWTLIWAFFATFTNYFLGMMVAMLINKKGIKLKKLWRTILVFSIAIPQFISLLYVSKMFSSGGLVNIFMRDTFGMTLPFWTDATWARITVIIINIWIGIPYLMLITTGILMNIPADLYESSKIDGASPFQQYMKITLPYMLFVTGPYLLTSFTGNMNNFNVIFLLTGGAPKTGAYYGSAGKTDLLITWLYSLTVDQTNYKLAAVIGILIFVVVAALSLIVYNLIPSTKNEEDFA